MARNALESDDIYASATAGGSTTLRRRIVSRLVSAKPRHAGNRYRRQISMKPGAEITLPQGIGVDVGPATAAARPPHD